MKNRTRIFKATIGLLILASILIYLIFNLVNDQHFSILNLGVEMSYHRVQPSQPSTSNNPYTESLSSKSTAQDENYSDQTTKSRDESCRNLIKIILLVAIWFFGICFSTFAHSVAKDLHERWLS